ncbi:MAG: glycosyltransferase [Anaerovibrio sp.]|uniref:glycosyltransferase family 2 protein n=1 Tax=Anaerovibrio sp. TaxID=1872532 RepID=UPI0025DC3C3A|nr:glycosyltransferase [Anaerovibrio sp.]MCR5176641.1 glycosyltransferase [Anaerovibrio sp.]
MMISAVYIAKNEAHNIVRSLESIKGTADELILVDTGSTDKTVDIFKSYGGQVYYQEWSNDFSVARNLAMSKATGDWLIILDADEYFTEETCNNIREIIASLSSRTNGLLVSMENYDKSTGERLDNFYALRLVRNINGLNYKGRIHESLYHYDKYLSGLQQVSGELLKIIHTGYSSNISKEKAGRNLAIIRQAIAEGEPVEHYYTYLYECYTGLGDIEKAMYYARLDVTRGRQPITYASRSYRGLINYYAGKPTVEGKENHLAIVELAVKDFPELPEFHAEYSECLYQRGRYRDANKEIEMAISLYENYHGLEPCLMTDEMLSIMQKRQQEISKMAEKDIKISACVIVRNEADNIRSWLENVQIFADEIIINDTGSEDATKSLIAEFSEENPELSIILLESLWEDNFSLAKNQCLAEATGDWIVFTDADELFRTPVEVRNALYSLREGNNELQVVMVPMVNIDRDHHNAALNTFNSVRIYKNEPGLQYEGRIHEAVTINGQGIENLHWCISDNRLLIEHTGYSSSINPRKAERNIKLLNRDIEDGTDIRKLYRYLAECYYTLEEYGKALDNALLATQSPYQPLGQQGDMYWLALNAMEKLDYGVDDQVVLADTGIRLFPNLPDFYARKGFILTEQEKYQEAVQLLEKSLSQIGADKENSSNIASVMHEVYTKLGIGLYHIGNGKLAEEYLIKALGLNPWNDDAICGWADIYDGVADNAFIEKLKEIYEGEKGYQEILSNIFAVNGFPELSVYFGKLSKDLLINQKSYQYIYNQAMKGLAEILPALFVCLLEKYDKEYARMLPEGLHNIVKYIHGLIGAESIAGLYGDYKVFFKEILLYGSDTLIERYIEMISIFSGNELEKEQRYVEIAEIMTRNNCEQLALKLYEMIPAESPSANDRFWEGVGICFYQLSMYAEAVECFKHVKVSLRSNSYKNWCQEALKNGN